MYEDYTRQSLPLRKYRELLGSALCVFNSNTQFVIENLIFNKPSKLWYKLTDKMSGKLLEDIQLELSIHDESLADLYKELTEKRNRIIHGFQITDVDGEQRLCTKTRSPDNKQFVITEKYLLEFIKQNENLSDRLYKIRDRLQITEITAS